MRISILSLILCSLVIPLAACGYSIQEAEEDLRDHNCDRVLEELNPAQMENTADRVYAYYLLGTAAYTKKDYDRALPYFKTITSGFQESRWFVKATYRMADCLMELKKYTDAEKIYAKGAEGLLSKIRRAEIADIYIHHANIFYAPEKKDRKPSYDRARTLYERACEILPKSPRWERASYQIAMTFFKQEKWNEAAEKFNQLIDYYESAEQPAAAITKEATATPYPNPYPEGGYLDDAMLRRAEALFRLNSKVEARRIWKRMCDSRRTISPHPKIVAEAAFRIAGTYNIPNPSNDRELALGIRSVDEYIKLFPEHEKVPLAALQKAQAYYSRHQFDKSLPAFRDFLDRYSSKSTPEQKAEAELHVARCLLNLEKYDEAIEAFQGFLAHHPVDKNWSEAQRSIVDTRYRGVESLQREAEKERARWERRLKNDKQDPKEESIPEAILVLYRKAREGWESFQHIYPLDSRMANIHLLLGKNERILRHPQEAISIWKDIASKYPQSNQASEALYSIAETTEMDIGDVEKAIELYGEVKHGPFQNAAQERIRALREVYLAVQTERMFQTGENPVIHVTSRNVDNFTCKLFPLELRAYFESLHTIQNVEDLDVNLIAPDKVWEVTPENYEKYKQLERDIPIPAEGPGAWVVQIESKTLEAVSLLVVSNLAVTIKGGKKEVFVYAEDQCNERPVADADVLVSDGRGVIAQGKTNRDGVYHVQDLETVETDRLSVFAAYKNNWAGEILGINNLRVSTTLQPRVFIYTDRPAYQPGDEVHYRAIVREIEDGHYVIPQDSVYEIAAIDARGAIIEKQESRLSSFGTLNGGLLLNEASPLGQYRIMVSRKDGPSGAWVFEVQEFSLPTARAEIETERNTFFYGDKIEGTIRVSDFSDNPLAGERVTYLLASETREGITDKEGKIEFSFETWDLPEEGHVPIHAIVPNRQIQGSKIVTLVTTGFYITLKSIRNTYLAGEPFQIDISAIGRDDKKEHLAQPLEINLQKRNDEGAYETVETRHVTTSPDKQKEISIAFTVRTGGRYRVAAEGKDQRGTLVSSQRNIYISGDDDENKLLILNDNTRYQQGETAGFVVVSRLPENIVLLTGEREGVVEYRIEKLNKGKNTIKWVLDERYSPECTVSLVVMDDNEVYHRDVRFQVHRGLDVTITPNAETYLPRDEAEFLIETRDHTGKPAAAEFSLGLVDAALLALYPDRVGDLTSFFDQAPRGRFIATTSSADFSYDGITRPISKEILKERLDVEEAFELQDELAGGLRAGRGIRKAREAEKAIRAGIELRRTPVPEVAARLTPLAAEPAPAERLRRFSRGRAVDGRMAGDAVLFDNALALDMDKNGLAEGEKLNALGYVAGKKAYLGTELKVMNAPASTVAAGALKYTSSRERYFAGYGGFGGGGFGLVETDFLSEGITRSYFPETAYFNPALFTDVSGKTTIRIKLPDSLTSWEAQIRAITKDTLANQSKKKIIVDKPYRVGIETPAFLTEGDRASGTVLVQNNTDKKRTARSVFTQFLDDRQTQSRWESTFEAGESHKRDITLSAKTVGEATLKLESRAGDSHDAMEKSLSVKPWGIPVRVGASGLAGQSLFKELSLPSQADYSRLSMWITLGGIGDISLLSSAWMGDGMPRSTRSSIERGLAALAVLDYVEQSHKTDLVPVEVLREQVSAAVSHAVATQSDQDLWSWGGNRRNREDILTSGRVTELLSRAKKRGYIIPDKMLEKVAAKLAALYQASNGDDEKTHILYAWSHVGSIDFAFVNRIHRNLDRLDNYDTALLGLTWLNMGRVEKAQEIMNLLLRSRGFGPVTATERTGIIKTLPINTNELWATVARLYFLLPVSSRTEPQSKRFLDRLAGDIPINTIVPTIPHGLRIQALAAYLASAAEEESSFELAVKVNGREILRKRTSRASLPAERIEIDPKHVKSAKNRVDFVFTGSGSYRYSVVLEGQTRQDVKPQDWLKPQDRRFASVERTYEHGPLEYNHQEIQRGYEVVAGEYERVKNSLEEVPYGNRVNIRLHLVSPDLQDYILVEDRLPAGFYFLEDSVSGPVDHVVQRDNTVLFYLRGPRKQFTVRYQLRGRFPGVYRVPPAIVTSAEYPEQIYATSSRSVTVLKEGEKPKEEYNLTPDELYNLGLRCFEDGKLEKARELLTTLFNSYSLKTKPFLEVTKKLFQIHLQGNNPEELVRYFEIIKERDREFEIQFEHIAKLAQAYRDIGEQERAVYVYRSLLTGLFLQEGAVSGTLHEVGRHRDALDYGKQLLLEYPDLPPVQTAVYTTGSLIYQNVNQWANEPEFLQSGNDKKTLLAEAVGMIQSFLALYPNHPSADEAGYTLINLWLDRKNYEVVAKLGEAFTERCPQSTYLDSFNFLNAYALFQLERYDRALKLAEKIWTDEYPAPGGGMKKSDEANTAIHMAGKILHAAGELAKAIQQYERIKDTFNDAAEAFAFLTKKGLEMEDVSFFREGEPARITLRHKNVDKADLRVYKVDLMTYYLMAQNLEEMTGINLAGITPVVQRTLELDSTKKYDWNETEISLPLTDKGAYLAAIGGNGVWISGMILRSDLELEVQENARQGIVRVNIRSATPAQFAKNVKVQVRGNQNDRFTSGDTDLRGVFTASGINGVATVLAQAGDQYGFYRGSEPLGQAVVSKQEQAGQARVKLGEIRQLQEEDALGNNWDRLQKLQEQQLQQWNFSNDPTNNRLMTQKAASLY